jgi:hypothetical protein
MSIKVEFGFSESGVPVSFNDITADVVSVSVNRGKDPQQDTFNASTCSVQLRNNLRQYDPDYGPSPYQGLIVPTGEIKISSNDQIIFTGFITDWNFSYAPNGESLAEIVGADAFWNLNNQTLTDYEPSEQLTSERIQSILNRADVGGTAVWAASKRVISTGVATVGDYDVEDGTNALSYLQEVEKSEPGRLFIDKQGRIVFRSRANDINNPVFQYRRLNLSINPSFENNTTGWTAISGTVTRVTSTSYIGEAAGRITAAGVVEQYFDSTFGDEYTVSIYARRSTEGTANATLSAIVSSDGVTYTEVNPVTVEVNSTTYTRIHTTFQANSLFSGIRITSPNALVWDAVLIEKSPILDAYFDGDNIPVYDPSDPDYNPQRAFETYETEWVFD